jgi:hypothetical protein
MGFTHEIWALGAGIGAYGLGLLTEQNLLIYIPAGNRSSLYKYLVRRA